MANITTRRTIRKYTAEDVPSDLQNDLMKKADRTQTNPNQQLYSGVTTRDPVNKARLAPLHFNQPMVQNEPVELTFCADFHRTTEWAKRRKGQPGYNNILSFLNAASDALLFCQTFCHLAEEAGLGLCYLGTTVYNPSGIIDALALPRLVMPVATITLGWPAEEPPLTDRLPLSAILHEEKYQPITDESIDRDYRYKESLPENQRFVEENQKETLAQVFTDCRYTKRDNEALSATLLEALRRQGFLD